MAKEDFSKEEIRRPESGCILKIKTNGRSFRGLVNYQSERGIDMDGVITQQPLYTNMLGRTPRELSREIAVVRRLRPGLNTAIGHLQICPSRALKTKEEWTRAVDIALAAHGISDAPFVCYLHSEGDGKTNHAHLHIAFSRIRYDATVISDSNSFRKNEAAARDIEKEFGLGLIQTRPKERRPYSNQKAFDSLRREDRLKEDIQEKKNGYVSAKNSLKGPKKMATKENIEKMAAAVERAMQRATSESEFKESLEKDLEEQGIGRQVKFARRGAENEIYGFSLVSDLGSGIKGSELGRHLSWTKVAAEIAENQARRRRMARAADAEVMEASIALASLARPAAQAALGQVPGPLADVGMPVAGFQMQRQETGEGRVYYQYLDGAGDVAFQDQDVPDAILIFAQTDDAVLAAVKLAVQRHGPVLDCSGAALQDPEFRRRLVVAACAAGAVIHPLQAEIATHRQALAAAADAKRKAEAKPTEPALDFLNVAAANDGDEDEGGVDPAAGGSAGASAAAASEGEGAPLAQLIDLRRAVEAAEESAEPEAPEHDEGDFVVEALKDLGASHEADVARLDALDALGLGVSLSRGFPPRVVPPLPGQRDIDGRLQRAHQVTALAKLLPPIPTEAEAARMGAAELRGVELLWGQLGPVKEWASVTAERHQREAALGRSSAQEIALASAESDARVAGLPLATEVTRLATADVRAKLNAAKAGFEGMGFLEKAAESVSGRRAAEVSQLEDELRRSERASLRARREFDESEAGKLAATEIERRQAAYWAEKEALDQPFIGTLAQSLAQVLAKLARWVAAAVRRETKDVQDLRQREQIVEEARLEAGGAVADDAERAPARRDRGRGG